MTQLEDDITLLRACLRGSADAQAALYHRHKAALFGVCLRYSSDREEARDWLQDGFVKIFEDLHQYRPTGPLGGWMRRVMVNTALMHLRKRRNLKVYNRWGKLVFQSDNPSQGWDGGGHASDVYIYSSEYIEAGETKVKKQGELTLLR